MKFLSLSLFFILIGSAFANTSTPQKMRCGTFEIKELAVASSGGYGDIKSKLSFNSDEDINVFSTFDEVIIFTGEEFQVKLSYLNFVNNENVVDGKTIGFFVTLKGENSSRVVSRADFAVRRGHGITNEDFDYSYTIQNYGLSIPGNNGFLSIKVRNCSVIEYNNK
jgi:hypothetical protein